MKSASTCLKDLALIIGWKLVNDDKGFSTYEFEVHVSKHETDSFVIRILDAPNELEVYEILLGLIKVLPRKLRGKINKLIAKFKLQDFENLTEVAGFTIEEYKKTTDFSKLYEYGQLIGVDILEKGYTFEYKLKKNKKVEILSLIEFNLPVEKAPILGKIRKLDYKIAYMKNSKIQENDND